MAVLDVTTGEAVRQICRVFRELYVCVVMENQGLRDKVGHLEAKLRSNTDTNNKGATQTLYKIKPSGQCYSEMSRRA